MRKQRVLVYSTDDREKANAASALLASMDLDAQIEEGAQRRYGVSVDAAEVDAARALVSELEQTADRSPTTGAPGGGTERPYAPRAWFGRGSLVVVAIVVGCVWIHASNHGASDLVSRARMIELGAITWALVEQGEYWRLGTAIFLHFSVIHLLSNMVVFLIVAPPLAHLLGTGRFLAVFLSAGVSGNIASHLLAPSAGLKAGASGAVAGVIGALGGRALANKRPGSRPSWQVFGALLGFYGLLIGFGPGRDNTAHLFGLLSGVLYGWLLAEDP